VSIWPRHWIRCSRKRCRIELDNGLIRVKTTLEDVLKRKVLAKARDLLRTSHLLSHLARLRSAALQWHVFACNLELDLPSSVTLLLQPRPASNYYATPRCFLSAYGEHIPTSYTYLPVLCWGGIHGCFCILSSVSHLRLCQLNNP
jgi:hypothetical protein